jgi:hypothetical protein
MVRARLIRWAGIALSVTGVALMISSGPLSRAWADAYMLDVPIDWLLLTGMIAVICGGLLVQTTWAG